MQMNRGLRQIIGLYELLTGGFGTLFLVYSILLAGGGSLPALVFLALYALTALAGWWLWKGRPAGVRLSIFAQAAQLVSLSARWIRFTFNAGLALWLHLGSAGLRLDHGLGPQFNFGWATGWGPSWQPYPVAIGVNLVAMAILLYLLMGGRKSSRKRR